MSLVITKGYLINKSDYKTFDSIITFINEFGNKFTCLAPGTRKIVSKNARSFNIGNYNEFEFFCARTPDKVSKLKRSVAIVQQPWPIYKNSFYLLNELINKISTWNVDVFKFYDRNIKFINFDDNNDQKKSLIILKEFCIISGLNLDVKSCHICGSNKIMTISFKQRGLICNSCYNSQTMDNYEINLSKLACVLFRGQYEKMDNFENEYNFLLKLIKIFIKDNLGLKIETLNEY